MRSVNVLMPEDLITALNEATLASGRTSCSDMVRVILRDYLITRKEKLYELRTETVKKATLAAERRQRKLKRLPYKCVHINDQSIDGKVEVASRL